MANKENIAQKEKEVKELAEKFKNSGLVLLVDYRGINVEDVTNLRKAVRDVNGEYAVIKNNITRRALKECGYELPEELVGPTAVIMTGEEYLPVLKVIYKFAKENDFYTIKSGVLEGKVSTVEELNTLAVLPSKEELIAKLAGCLLANVSKLAATLDAVRVQKENAEQ